MSIAALAASLLIAVANGAVSSAAISVPGTGSLPITTTVTTPQPSQITSGVTQVVTKTPTPVVRTPAAPVPLPAPAPPRSPVKVPKTPAVKVPSASVPVPGGSTVRTPSASVGGPSAGSGGGGGGGTGVSVGGTGVSVGGSGGGGPGTGSSDTVRRIAGTPDGLTGVTPTGPGGGPPAGGGINPITGGSSGPGAGGGGTSRGAGLVPISGMVNTAQLVALVTSLQGCLAALPPLQRDLLIFRAGLDGGGSRSISQLARALGVSPARAGLIQRRAIQGLRSASLHGTCGGGTAIAYSAGLFASPSLLGSPLGALFGPGEGATPSHSRVAPGTGSAGYLTGARRSVGETLRGLNGDSGPGPLVPALAILLFLAASAGALMREARRSI